MRPHDSWRRRAHVGNSERTWAVPIEGHTMPYALIAVFACGLAVGVFVVLAPADGYVKAVAVLVFVLSLALPVWWPRASVLATLLQVVEGGVIITYFRVTGG